MSVCKCKKCGSTNLELTSQSDITWIHRLIYLSVIIVVGLIMLNFGVFGFMVMIFGIPLGIIMMILQGDTLYVYHCKVCGTVSKYPY